MGEWNYFSKFNNLSHLWGLEWKATSIGTDLWFFLLGLLRCTRHWIKVGSRLASVWGWFVQLEVHADLMLLVLVRHWHLELGPWVIWASFRHLIIGELRGLHNELELGSRLMNPVSLLLLISSTAHHTHDGLGERTVTGRLRHRLVFSKLILLLEFTFLGEFRLFWLVLRLKALASRGKFLALFLVSLHFSLHSFCHVVWPWTLSVFGNLFI